MRTVALAPLPQIRLDNLTTVQASNDIMTELNGLPEEHILIAGAVRLSTRATSKLWRDQVIEFIAIGDRSIDELLEAIRVPHDTPPELRARCP